MRVRRFDNGNINIQRDRFEPYLSLDTFIELLIEKLETEIGIQVERVSKDTLRYKGTDWVITYDMLDSYNWDFYIKCKVWSEHITYKLYK